jgi:hypothetical protein
LVELCLSEDLFICAKLLSVAAINTRPANIASPVAARTFGTCYFAPKICSSLPAGQRQVAQLRYQFVWCLDNPDVLRTLSARD